MPKTREQKQKIIEEITQDFSKQKSVVFVDYKGLKVKDMQELRRKIKKIEGKLIAVKKTLISLVLKKQAPELEGQVALVFGFKDPIKPIKEIYEISQKNENLRILSGIFEGKVISKEDLIVLAQLPTKEELLARFVRTIASPMLGFMNVLEGNLRNLVLVLSNIKK